jgi:hypothetical protein
MSAKGLRKRINSAPFGFRYVHLVKDCENPDRQYYLDVITELNKSHCGKLFGNIATKYLEKMDELEARNIYEKTIKKAKNSEKKTSLADRLKGKFYKK